MKKKDCTHLSNTCCICDEIATRIFTYDYYGTPDRILFESNDFVVFPSLSPLVEGHLLIFSKRHVPNMMSLEDNALERLIGIVRFIAARLRSKYGNILIFEHGSKEGSAPACGIGHAHVHLLPLDRRIIDGLFKKIISEYPSHKENSIENIYTEGSSEQQYLLVSDDSTKKTLLIEENIPSQFMRKEIAKMIGTEYWDWRNISGYGLFRSTLSSLKD